MTRQPEQRLAHQVGEGLGQFVEAQLHRHIARARQAVDPGFRQELTQHVGNWIALRQAHHVGGRALQHGHVLGLIGHCRHQGDSCRAAADHHHILAAVIEVFRPQLRVDKFALEQFTAFEIGGVARFIAVIAGAHQQVLTAQLERLGLIAALYLQRPGGAFTAPVGLEYLVLEADVLLDAVFLGRFCDIAADRRAVSDRQRVGPGFEVVAKGEHVRVGTDARVTEQIPGTAQRFSAFEDGEALAGAMLHQVIGRTDAGQAGTNDQDIQVFDRHGGSSGFLLWLQVDRSTRNARQIHPQ